MSKSNELKPSWIAPKLKRIATSLAEAGSGAQGDSGVGKRS